MAKGQSQLLFDVGKYYHLIYLIIYCFQLFDSIKLINYYRLTISFEDGAG